MIYYLSVTGAFKKIKCFILCDADILKPSKIELLHMNDY